MNIENKTAIFYITENGLKLSERLLELYKNVRILKFNSDIIPEIWNECKNLIFIMATGIVVRTIAPLIKNKKADPAVVVLDEKGRYVISLLSGHLGGANELAREIAEFLGGESVITTSSDVNNLTAIDLWARDKGLFIENEDKLPEIVRRLIDNGFINVYSEIEMELPPEFKRVSDLNSADLVISIKDSRFMIQDARLILRPKNLIVGIGCNSGTSAEEIEDAVRKVLSEKRLSFHSIHSIATIKRKASEPGLIDFAKRHGLEITSFNAEELNFIVNLQPSAFSLSETVFNATGAYGVSEPAALLASDEKELLIPKQKIGNVTVAVAVRQQRYRIQDTGSKQIVNHESCIVNHANDQCSTAPLLYCSKKIYIVGTGPGDADYITPRAIEAIRASDVIVGYKTYIELIKELIKDKEVISTGMTREIERAKKAVELAMSGKNVSVISGGDPGIYGMAGLVLEILRAVEQQSIRAAVNKKLDDIPYYKTTGLLHYWSAALPDVEVIPGISALNACASRLGAPLMHDFVCISLSDRLTEWSLIEKRLELAAEGDFVTVLYNPKSKGRPEHINRARDIFLRHRAPETPVGIVRGAMRSKEEVVIANLKDILDYDIDMQTTVIIGNSQTYVWNNWLITPRGYEKKMHRI